jgi:hypothetical protein
VKIQWAPAEETWISQGFPFWDLWIESWTMEDGLQSCCLHIFIVVVVVVMVLIPIVDRKQSQRRGGSEGQSDVRSPPSTPLS